MERQSALTYARGPLHFANVRNGAPRSHVLSFTLYILKHSPALKDSVLTQDLHTALKGSTQSAHTGGKAPDCLSDPTALQGLPQILPI